MNPYMTSFAVMGLLYTFIGVWALAIHSTGSIMISVLGVALCSIGWLFARSNE